MEWQLFPDGPVALGLTTNTRGAAVKVIDSREAGVGSLVRTWEIPRKYAGNCRAGHADAQRVVLGCEKGSLRPDERNLELW